MRSMTGYGSNLSKNNQLELEVQIRSVNARFLDLRFHLPKEYLAFEMDLKKRLAKVIPRGCVDVFVQRRPNAETRVIPVQLNKGQAKAWTKAFADLQKTVGGKETIPVSSFLSLPHIFEVNDRTPLDKQEESMLSKTFEAALKICQKSREHEGAQLQKELLGLLDQLMEVTELLGPWRSKVQEKMERRLQDRLKEMGAEADPARLAVETAFQLDKMDVREELVRLGEHVKVCRGFVKSGNSQGKKLDFYAQELLREVNTIGSKVQAAEMTELVVKAKTIIENFREQVQNVE